MKVNELMTTELRTCVPEDSLHRAAELMWKADIGCLPVIDKEQRVVGMITDRDICMAAYTQGGDLASRVVSGAMSKQVQACAPEESVAVAEERMRQNQIRRLPVVGNGRLVGLVALNDLAVAAGNRKSSEGGPITLDEVATTLCRISQHRPQHAVAAE